MPNRRPLPTRAAMLGAALGVVACGCGGPPRGPRRGGVAVAPTAGDAAAFAEGVYVAGSGVRLPYRLLAPLRPVPGRRYPLVVQLHGSGAIGTDNRAQLGPFAMAWSAPRTRERFPAYVLVPHFPARTAAYEQVRAREGVPASRALPPLAAALALVDSLRLALPVDTTRVYAVGFSMGGSSVWHALLDRPTTFAGAVAIAGVPPDAAALQRLPRVPLLLVHGTADTENPYASARSAFETLAPAARAVVEFRAYPDLAHAIPPDVLTGHWWREWLFRQHR